MAASSNFPHDQCAGSGFHEPTGVAVDAIGNVFVADYNNHAVEEMTAASGYASAVTIAGSVDPTALAVDANGNSSSLTMWADDRYYEILAVNGTIPASPTVVTLGNGFSTPYGIAVDGSGNVFVADSGNNRVVKFDFADPPTLTFATTNIGSTSSDSPQTVTITNTGNAELDFAVPAFGTNPSITPGFAIANTSTCPQLTTFAHVVDPRSERLLHRHHQLFAAAAPVPTTAS